MRYGMPYRGSKNKLAKWVIENLPKKENLYDLFGGGGAITHYATLSNKFKNVFYNEINPLIYKAFNMAIKGEFDNETRWISHKEFMELRYKDPYVALCFSFGGNLRSYSYSKEREKKTKILHELYYREHKQNNLLEHIQRLNRIKQLSGLKGIELYNRDYAEIEIKENSVIYCDIPYQCSEDYTGKRNSFDYDRFYSWCRKQKELVFISEYEMPENDFICIAQRERRSTFRFDDNTTIKAEKLFVPKHQYQMYLDAMAVLI